MAYTFPQDIKDIKAFYNNGRNHFNSLVGLATNLPMEESLHVLAIEDVSKKSASFGRILRRNVPVMLCSAWESFVDELKDLDLQRHQKYFVTYGVWYNEDIKEICLIRNCITHAKSKTDSNYYRDTLKKTFPVLGTSIDFGDQDLDIYFKIFEDAYNQIMI
jgi:hypothetical protein